MEYLQNFNFKITGNIESDNYLVFLHGLMGSGINWSRIAKLFGEDYQILLYDQRGHGRSFKPKTGYHPNDYAEDLVIIIDELGWDKISLVGHSMGGRNAIHFVGNYPERIHKAVIEDISPSVRKDSIDSMKKLINSVPVPFTDKKTAQNFFKDQFLEQFTNKEQGKVIAQFFMMNIIEKSSGIADWRFFKQGILETLVLGRNESAWETVDDLKVPTLFLYGGQSDELTESDLERLKKNNHIKTRCIQGAGHWVHFDQPEEFGKVLGEFLTLS